MGHSQEAAECHKKWMKKMKKNFPSQEVHGYSCSSCGARCSPNNWEYHTFEPDRGVLCFYSTRKSHSEAYKVGANYRGPSVEYSRNISQERKFLTGVAVKKDYDPGLEKSDETSSNKENGVPSTNEKKVNKSGGQLEDISLETKDAALNDCNLVFSIPSCFTDGNDTRINIDRQTSFTSQGRNSCRRVTSFRVSVMGGKDEVEGETEDKLNEIMAESGYLSEELSEEGGDASVDANLGEQSPGHLPEPTQCNTDEIAKPSEQENAISFENSAMFSSEADQCQMEPPKPSNCNNNNRDINFMENAEEGILNGSFGIPQGGMTIDDSDDSEFDCLDIELPFSEAGKSECINADVAALLSLLSIEQEKAKEDECIDDNEAFDCVEAECLPEKAVTEETEMSISHLTTVDFEGTHQHFDEAFTKANSDEAYWSCANSVEELRDFSCENTDEELDGDFDQVDFRFLKKGKNILEPSDQEEKNYYCRRCLVKKSSEKIRSEVENICVEWAIEIEQILPSTSP